LGGDNITVDRQSAINKRFAKGEKEVMFKGLVSQSSLGTKSQSHGFVLNQKAIPGAGGLTTRTVQKKERPSFVVPLRFPGRSKTTALQAEFFGGALSHRPKLRSMQMDSVLESPENNSRRMKNTSIFGDKPLMTIGNKPTKRDTLATDRNPNMTNSQTLKTTRPSFLATDQDKHYDTERHLLASNLATPNPSNIVIMEGLISSQITEPAMSPGRGHAARKISNIPGPDRDGHIGILSQHESKSHISGSVSKENIMGIETRNELFFGKTPKGLLHSGISFAESSKVIMEAKAEGRFDEVGKDMLREYVFGEIERHICKDHSVIMDVDEGAYNLKYTAPELKEA
jgi:hypothetical protein